MVMRHSHDDPFDAIRVGHGPDVHKHGTTRKHTTKREESTGTASTHHCEKRNVIPSDFYGNIIMDNLGKTLIQVVSQDATSCVDNVGGRKTKCIVGLEFFKSVSKRDSRAFNDKIRQHVKGVPQTRPPVDHRGQGNELKDGF